MITALIALSTLISGHSSVAPQTIDFAKTYVSGEKHPYKLVVDITGEQTIHVEMDVTEKITDVLKNGNANLEEDLSNLAMTVNGQGVPVPVPPTFPSIEVDPYGNYVNTSAKVAMNQNAIARVAYASIKTAELGVETKVDNVLKSPPATVKGSYKLVSISGTDATVNSDINVVLKGLNSPLHLVSTAIIDTQTKWLKSLDLNADGLDKIGGAASMFQHMHITMKQAE